MRLVVTARDVTLSAFYHWSPVASVVTVRQGEGANEKKVCRENKCFNVHLS